jgi:hypothetical protein
MRSTLRALAAELAAYAMVAAVLLLTAPSIRAAGAGADGFEVAGLCGASGQPVKGSRS